MKRTHTTGSITVVAGSLSDALSRQEREQPSAVRYLVDVSCAGNRDQFFSATYKAMFASDVYGHNLDAFEDVAVDAIHGDPAEGRYFDWSMTNADTCVIISGLDALVVSDPAFCESLLRVFDSCSRAAHAQQARLTWVIHVSNEAYDSLLNMARM